MTGYVASALFIYSQESDQLLDRLRGNTFGAEITPVEFTVFQQDPTTLLRGVEHVIVSGSLEEIKTVIGHAMQHDFSVGIIPLKSQKSLKKYFVIPGEEKAAVELALQQPAKRIDIILCNENILLFKATIGRLPLLNSPGSLTLWNLMSQARSQLKGIKLLGFSFTTESGKKIKTAACGCMIIQHSRGSLAARMIRHRNCFSDGMVSLAVAAPLSIIEYLKFLAQALQPSFLHKRVARTMGYIESPQILIESEQELDVFIDDERATHTPVHCKVAPRAVRINIAPVTAIETSNKKVAKEILDIRNLPLGNELIKAKKRAIPFFSYASEERFQDLFTALRDDARLSASYLILMFLSTMLATIGLYLNSSSVVIGAMLLAPLMSPIVSLAMGLLRQDQKLLIKSAQKIAIGIAIALCAAALVALLFPHKPVTNEMLARLSPSLLDLAVAIFAGIAGAYTKSHKEILQSLAGVAIAVALVPPLVVAGTGLGRLDIDFFSQAFLLFSTNLVGIVLAATLTFRVLGYSAVIKNKRNVGIVVLMLALITVPLYFSYDEIVDKLVLEKSWTKERFLVNGKYLIVQKAHLAHHKNKLVITMDILARERLTRADMDIFQKKIQENYSKKLIIRANIVYIL